MTTEQECVEALRTAANRLDGSPTKAEYEELGLTPAASTILRVMGSWNEAKAAAGLATNYSRGSRVSPKPDHVSLPDGVSWADLSQDQRWHYRHRDWNTERTRKRRHKLRQWVREQKAADDGCRYCEEDDPACLDYHHPDDANKEMAITEMVTHGYGRDALRDEIEGCEVVCANCHWQIHHEGVADQLDGATADSTKAKRLRAWTYEHKCERACQRCGEDQPICLQFHHVEEKTLGVGAMIANSYPEAKIRGEVDKCIVLCANCHRKEHDSSPETTPPPDDG